MDKTEYADKLFSDFIYVRTYSRYLWEEGRREQWEETVERYCNFIFTKCKNADKIPEKVKIKAKQYILSKDIAPSMRALWAAGENAERDNTAMYNCAGIAIDTLATFGEIMYILLAGSGVGFSVERRYITKLPAVVKQQNREPLLFCIPDSREGWKQAVDFGINAWFEGRDVVFDYSLLRPAGSPLLISGGYSSGPSPLQRCLEYIRETLIKSQGRKLNSLEVADIICEISASVVCGGVRRSSTICLSDVDDDLLKNCKQSEFHPRRHLMNISAVYRSKPDVLLFTQEFIDMARSGSGERGLVNLVAARKRSLKKRDKSKISLINPCAEVTLRSDGEFCNLTEVVIRATDDFDTVQDKIRTATWLGCLQSTFTYFPHLRDVWTKNCEEERLLGVSLTGICDNKDLITPDGLKYWKKTAKKTAKQAAELLEINEPCSLACIKPSGCRPSDGLTTLAEGILTLEELLSQHEDTAVWSNKVTGSVIQGKDQINKIKHSYRNGMSDIIRITMTHNLTIESTFNHKWFVKFNHSSSLRHGEKTTRYGKDINTWVEAQSIKLGDVLDIELGIYNSNQDVKLRDVSKNNLYFNTEVIKQPQQINSDLAWLLGYLWGDGAMSPSHYRFRFIDANMYNLEKVKRIFKEQFGLDTVIKRCKDREAFSLDKGSHLLWDWFITNGFYKYKEGHTLNNIPIAVRKSSYENIISFIAGLVDSDGNISTQNGLTRVMIANSQYTFSKHLQDISWAVGLGFGRSHNTEGENKQCNKSMYLLGLSPNVIESRFALLVQHSNKIQEFLKSCSTPKWNWQNEAINKRIVGKVVKIEILPEPKETFDIEVDEEPWYYAGAIKSHNTVSLLVNSSAGMHSRYAKFYERRVRISTHDALFKTMVDQGMPYTMDKGNHDTAIFSFPCRAPDGAHLREDDKALEQLAWYRMLVENWADMNVSCTIYVRDEEWLSVVNYVYEHFDTINGISFFPYDNKKYEDAPFEEIDEKTYLKMVENLPLIDFTLLSKYEKTDTTSGSKEFACAGGSCDLV